MCIMKYFINFRVGRYDQYTHGIQECDSLEEVEDFIAQLNLREEPQYRIIHGTEIHDLNRDEHFVSKS